METKVILKIVCIDILDKNHSSVDAMPDMGNTRSALSSRFRQSYFSSHINNGVLYILFSLGLSRLTCLLTCFIKEQ